MILNALEISVLGWILYDYESPHTISGNVAQDLGRSVTEQEVLEALTALAIHGLATPFNYDASTQSYRKVQINEEKKTNDLWFFASPSGRALSETFDE